MLSSGLRKVSWKQNTDGLYSEINNDTSLKLGFKPRQFHCIILCLKSILENNIKRVNKIMVRLKPSII